MKKQLIQAAGLITGIAIISKVLGFVRELLMASYFGTSTVADAYFVASIIPVLLFSAVGMSITTGIIPLYAELKKQHSLEARNVVGVLTTLFLILALAITVIAILFTPIITQWMAPGFTEEQWYVTNVLTIIMLPSFCFYVLSAVSTGILEYEKEFAPPAMGAIPQNILIIISIVVLSQFYGIYGVAIATLLGAISQFLVQYPFIKKYKVIRLNFHFKTYSLFIKRTFFSFMPLIITSIAFQFNTVIDRFFASGLIDGSVSALNYANKLMFLPLSIILLSFITVLFPSIIDTAAENKNELTPLIISGMTIISLVGIPISAVMLIESRTLIEVAYERGAFNTNATTITSIAFFFYTIGMIAIALKEFLNRSFIALQNEKMTMIAAIVSIIVNIIFSLILTPLMGIGGVALATSISMVSQTVVLLYFLRKELDIPRQEMKDLLFSQGKVLTMFLLVTGVLFGLHKLYHSYLPALLSISVTTFTAVIFTILVATLLRISEMEKFAEWARTLKRKP